MRIPIKVIINARAVQESEIKRANAIVHNTHDPFASVPVNKPVKPKFKVTDLGLRTGDILNYYVEPIKDRDIIVKTSTMGDIRCPYSPELESQLELIFKIF